ncbi:pentapeptide repeat-containing protein [Amaricoccus tamworthensis]|uniref:pentapeptide repeat-containing protein n=1 Tax=Amaricoccus tamworthensis TaxID=57002 RepID=UPI003C7D5569
MANRQHIEWLLEGVEAWNARRERKNFDPDFSHTDLRNVLPSTDEIPPNFFSPLREMNLNECDFSNSKMNKAHLSGVRFYNSNFLGTDLNGANLSHTTNIDGNFRSTNFDSSILRACTFSGLATSSTNFKNADVRSIFSPDLPGRGAFLVTSLVELEGLSQGQLNLMIGDRGVRLPPGLTHPNHWPEPRPPNHLTDDWHPTDVEERFSNIEAPIDIIWTHDERHRKNYLVAVDPTPIRALPPVPQESQKQQLKAVGQLAGQIKISIRASQTGNVAPIIGDISSIFEAIEREVNKPDDLVLIVVVKANILALERLAPNREALSDVDQALFDVFMTEARTLLGLYPILSRIEDPNHAELVPEESLDASLAATEYLIDLLTSEPIETVIGPSLPGVTRDLAIYPWSSERKKVAVFAAVAVRLKRALEDRPPWMDGLATYATIISAVTALLVKL